MEKIEKAINTCIDMVYARGYVNVYMTEDENAPCLIYENPTTKDRLHILLNVDGKVIVDHIKHFLDQTNELGLKHCIILYSSTITPRAKRIIDDEKMNILCETFSIDEMQYNITEHYLVPKHIVLTRKQAIRFKNKYGTSFPVLLSSDPVSRFYNFSTGDIVRVERKNGIIVYRIVK